VIKQLKKFTIQMIAGANVATVIVMLLVGYSDRLNPTEHPILSTIGMTFPIFLLLNLLFVFFWLVFKWSKVWIPIVGYMMAYVPISIYFPLNRSQAIPDDALKLISYNVCAYGGNYKYDEGLDVVVKYLCEEKADIVCIQEDVDTWRGNAFKQYQRAYAYNDTLVLVKSDASYNALGIHTRFPILKRERIDYLSKANGSAAWWLDVKGDTVIVVNNHFESCHLSSEDRHQYREILHGNISGDSARTESKLLLVKLAEANAKRAGQIRAVQKFVDEHKQYPIILCGDFNDSPISYSHHVMSEVLTDCYKETGRGIGLSYNQRAFSFRIDHVFCSDDFKPIQCKIDSRMDASDHNPVICWLKIR